MPDNPARALALIAEQWKTVPQGQTQEQFRGSATADVDLAFWRDHAHALDLLQAVERGIRVLAEAGKRVGHYEKHVPALYTFLFGYTVPWRTSEYMREAVGDGPIDMLWGLAEVLDSYELGWSDNSAENVEDVLRSITALLESDSEMDPRSRQYIAALVAELRHALGDVERFGTALVRRLSNELAGLLLAEANAAVGHKDGESRAKAWFGAARTLVVIVTTAVVSKGVELAAGTVFPELHQ